MAVPVRFVYFTGIKRNVFSSVRVRGSWDAGGRYSEQWSDLPMELTVAPDGTPCFAATVNMDDSQTGVTFRWNVYVDSPPAGNRLQGVTTEVSTTGSNEQYRTFVLRQSGSEVQEEKYYLINSRRLGANKVVVSGQTGADTPGIRFAVW